MTSSRDSMWPVQEPSRDFAARTVDAMLTAGVSAPIRRRPRFVLYLALAAVFATGTALAIVGARSRARTRLNPEDSEPKVMGAASYSIRAQSVSSGRTGSAVTSASSSHRPVLSAPTRAVKPLPASSVRAPMRQPACQCERGFSDFICDCY